jgi:hypothetical protein
MCRASSDYYIFIPMAFLIKDNRLPLSNQRLLLFSFSYKEISSLNLSYEKPHPFCNSNTRRFTI